MNKNWESCIKHVKQLSPTRWKGGFGDISTSCFLCGYWLCSPITAWLLAGAGASRTFPGQVGSWGDERMNPRPDQRKAGNTDQATRSSESETRSQRGQDEYSFCSLVPSAKMSPHFILTTSLMRGALLTSLQRGQNKLGEVKYHARGPRLGSAEFWLKSRSVWPMLFPLHRVGSLSSGSLWMV